MAHTLVFIVLRHVPPTRPGISPRRQPSTQLNPEDDLRVWEANLLHPARYCTLVVSVTCLPFSSF